MHIRVQAPDNSQSIGADILQGHNEALALVSGPTASAKDTSAESDSGAASIGQSIKQEALQRAKDLVQLHYEVKSRYADGVVDDELRQARDDVRRVLRELA